LSLIEALENIFLIEATDFLIYLRRNQKKLALIIFISVVFIIFIISLISRPLQTENPNDNEPPIGEESVTHSSKVSIGVNPLELGNIASGQFYFETEDDIFYSCYDEENNAHIYRTNKQSSTFEEIFDGFSWSLVVFDEKLYFSGNCGSKIDGTYHLYRMNLDGTELEELVPAYLYNIFF
jgi:hypothetical protein